MHGAGLLLEQMKPFQATRKVLSIANKYDVDCGSYDALYGDEQTGKLETLLKSGWAPGRRLVDVGCGTALLSAKLTAKCDLVVGLDVSLGMLRRGRKRIELVLGDASYPPFRPQSFTGGICFTSFHHFRNKVRAADETAALISMGGTLAFSLFETRGTIHDVVVLERCDRLETVKRLHSGRDSIVITERV